jgi:hypothetical protein
MAEVTPKMVTVIIRGRFCIRPVDLRNVYRFVQLNALRDRNTLEFISVRNADKC